MCQIALSLDPVTQSNHNQIAPNHTITHIFEYIYLHKQEQKE